MIFNRHYPVVRQYDQIDCGPASLLSILRYYRGDDNLVHVRELCKTNITGSNLFNLVEAAKILGFEAAGAKGEYTDLMKEKMPCIAHIIIDNQIQHFVVIYKINEKKVLIGDPGKGLLKLSKNEFIKIWPHKTVILLKPKSRLYKKINLKWHHWILNYLKNEESWVYQSLFLGIIYTVLGLLTAVFIQLLIDRFIPEGNYSKIIYTGIFLFLLLFIRTLSGYIRQKFLVELNKRTSIHINNDFLTHLFKLPRKFFDTRKTGDIMARINDSIRIQQAILLITSTTIIDGLIIIGSLILIFRFSVVLAWASLVAMPFYGILLWINSRKIKQHQSEVMKSYSIVESTYIDSLTGIDDIISFNSAPVFIKLNKFIFGHYQNKIENLGLVRSKLNFFAELSGMIITIGLLICGAFIVVNGVLMLGEMMAAYSLLANMLPSINRLVDANISLQGASVASQRLLDMLLVPLEEKNQKRSFKLKDSLKIRNGFFSWSYGKPLLAGINMDIKKGKINALWGTSGSGKSTLVQIIQRKYNFDAGDMRVDDIPANIFNLADFRKNVGIVPQNIKIFNGTLAENILCGRTVNTFDELEIKIKAIGLYFFIKYFEHGFFTLVGEDSRQLSGGEKQIIALIRALLDNPEILIIDEGLNAIDIDKETQIFNLIRNYSKTHAVLLISHNIKTILRSEYIYVLHKGSIIQEGSPDDLVRETGHFNDAWQIFQETSWKGIF